MGDYSNFITRAAGIAKLKNDLASRRYVGFTRGRVRDSASFVDNDDEIVGTITDFAAWTDSGTREYATWKAGSLFRFIDDEMRSSANGAPSKLGKRFAAVICDDPQPECADFIGLDKKRGEVVFVHAKVSDGDARLGASKLYEVCGQAIKNLAYLRMGNDSLPSKSEKWEEPWSVDNTGYLVNPRIRCGTKDVSRFKEQLFDLLRRPTTIRETWLVLGNTLSKAAMERAIKSNRPPAALLQSFHLLSSTYSQCKSVGVDLKVFCSK